MKKLAIVGSGSKTRDLAPFDDLSYDIWVINEAPMYPWCKRWNAAFQLHNPEIYTTENPRHPGYWEWLQQDHGRGKYIYMQTWNPRVPNATQYPIDEAVELCGQNYLTATVCYMAALAIIQKYEDVSIYGIELSATEYQYQADCWRFWVGLLIGKLGVDNVHIHSGEHLFQARLYGYDGNDVIGSAFFENRLRICEEEWKNADKILQVTTDEVIRAITHQDAQNLPAKITDVERSARSAGFWSCAIEEAKKHIGIADKFSDRNAFEFYAANAMKESEEKKVLMYHQGGIVEYIGNTWANTNNRKYAQIHSQAQGQLIQAVQKLQRLAYDLGAMEGAYTENQIYIHEFDAIAEANGGKMQQISDVSKVAMGFAKG